MRGARRDAACRRKRPYGSDACDLLIVGLQLFRVMLPHGGSGSRPGMRARKFRSRRARNLHNEAVSPKSNQTTRTNKGVAMNIHLSLGPLVSLIAGILILIMPRLLNFIVAIYLIVIGLIGLFGVGASHF
jgi:hypothetical protein